MKVRIIPSIASSDQLKIGEEIRKASVFPDLHIDIEDGNFVPNITFGMKTVRRIAEYAEQNMDVHLLVTDPLDYLEQLDLPGITAISVHYESLEYPLQALNRIRKMGRKAGLALNFKTPAEALLPFADSLDYVIVMTAEPDENGENLYPAMLEKVRRLRQILGQEKEIWADGGVNEMNIASVVGSGADTVVMGRAVFNEANPAEFAARIAVREIG